MSAPVVEICCEIKKETDKAFYVTDGVVSAWIPKSQAIPDQYGGSDDTAVFSMPEWLAIEKGFL